MPEDDKESLIQEVKLFIIETLALEDVSLEDIPSDAPLFGDGLGLDSVDALELGVAIQKRYKIRISGQTAETREHFASVRNLARFIGEQRGTIT